MIPIVLASDNNYLLYAYVTIYSILESRKENNELAFYLLVSNDVVPKDIDKTWGFTNYSIEYVVIAPHYFKNARQVRHITVPAYYRLLAPQFLAQYDKCIYLDVDILVFEDISELFNQQIENYDLGAGCGAGFPFDKSSQQQLADRLKLPSAEKYFNSGVLVMNLKKMRKENKVSEFIECSKGEWLCQDQDVLNICCYSKTKILPLKYNAYSIAYNLQSNVLQERYSIKEIEDMHKKPYLIHYAMKYTKPWSNTKTVMGKLWWDMAAKALKQEDYKAIYKTAEEKTDELSFEFLLAKCKNTSKIILFGCGQNGKDFFSMIQIDIAEKVIAFWDNDENKWGDIYCGIKIEEPHSMSDLDILYIITYQSEPDIIKKQLLSIGVPEKNVVCYIRKSETYFYGISPEFFGEIKADTQYDILSIVNLKRAEDKILE